MSENVMLIPHSLLEDLHFFKLSVHRSVSLTTFLCLNLQTKPVDPTVDGGAQVQQVVNIECVSDFMEAPILNIQFR